MPKPTLSERVALLEQTVAELVARKPREPGRDDWKSVVGMFDGDKLMERILKRGAAIRAAERPKLKAKRK